MIRIIAIILQAVMVAGGAYLGVSLRNSSGAEHSAEESGDAAAAGDEKDAKKEKSEKSDKKDKKKKKKKKGKDGYGDDYGDNSSFMKFSRQFIVPTVTANNIDALVILDINLELSASATENAYAREPKLRDAILTALLELSNEGAFRGHLTNQETMDSIRARVMASSQAILGDDVVGVLILSIARQDI